MWSLLRSPFWASKVSFWSPFNQNRSPKVNNGWFSTKKSHGLKMIFLIIHFTYLFSFFLQFQLGSWCECWLKLLSSLEKPSKRLILEVPGLGIESRWLCSQFVIHFVTTNPQSVFFMPQNVDFNLFVQKLSKRELLILSCFLKMLGVSLNWFVPP